MDRTGGPLQRRWQILAALCLSVPLAVMDESIPGRLVAADMILAALVWHPLRRQDHSLDVRLFQHLRFSAASGAIALAFTWLSGFISRITQYFQVVPGYDPLRADTPHSRWLLCL